MNKAKAICRCGAQGIAGTKCNYCSQIVPEIVPEIIHEPVVEVVEDEEIYEYVGDEEG